RITSSCRASVERQFHRLVLHTNCVGKPHLIKFMYFPKWRSDVEVQIGTNGFMVVEPKAETTVLEHRAGGADWLGGLISRNTIIGLVIGGRYRRSRGYASSRQAKP